MSRRRRRGYPVAVLIGLEDSTASLWNIYSESIKPDTRIRGKSNEYNFYEEIIDRLRPSIKQGVKTILVASTDEKKYQEFYKHIEKHQRWLIAGYELNRVTLQYVEGEASDIESITELIEETGLQRTIKEASRADVKRVLGVLEKRLGTPEGIDTLLFTLNEVDEAVYGEVSPEYILMTTEFQSRHRRRTQRLLQIAQNKEVKSLIVETGTPMGARVAQFGGLICMKRTV